MKPYTRRMIKERRNAKRLSDETGTRGLHININRIHPKQGLESYLTSFKKTRIMQIKVQETWRTSLMSLGSAEICENQGRLSRKSTTEI